MTPDSGALTASLKLQLAMKNTYVLALVLPAVGFAAAVLAHSLGYVSFDVLTPGGVAGMLIVAVALAFVCADYRRKPSFRVRRSSVSDASGSDFRSALPPPDWTYQTRAS